MEAALSELPSARLAYFHQGRAEASAAFTASGFKSEDFLNSAVMRSKFSKTVCEAWAVTASSTLGAQGGSQAAERTATSCRATLSRRCPASSATVTRAKSPAMAAGVCLRISSESLTTFSISISVIFLLVGSFLWIPSIKSKICLVFSLKVSGFSNSSSKVPTLLTMPVAILSFRSVTASAILSEALVALTASSSWAILSTSSAMESPSFFLNSSRLIRLSRFEMTPPLKV
mmetsp:Transcript_11530/g.26762  ORF Transcript_11530/g.26762 Transcript_11530/m.26762 type:complete len:231 (-) Transcript_11530:282-974(-)